jgi:hypothetical protein
MSRRHKVAQRFCPQWMPMPAMRANTSIRPYRHCYSLRAHCHVERSSTSSSQRHVMLNEVKHLTVAPGGLIVEAKLYPGSRSESPSPAHIPLIIPRTAPASPSGSADRSGARSPVATVFDADKRGQTALAFQQYASMSNIAGAHENRPYDHCDSLISMQGVSPRPSQRERGWG